jgi:type I restriction-modification system DNA methylase subunit
VKQNNAPEESLEKKLWKIADKLRKNMDAAEYKHVVMGLIFQRGKLYEHSEFFPSNGMELNL